MADHHEVIIIGSGPAGLTAAIYTSRANLKPLLLEGEPSSTSDQPGGQLMLTTDVENFPGFPEGVMGPDLMVRMRQQANRFGTEIVTKRARQVDFSTWPYGIWVENQDTDDPDFTSDAVIISTGARSLMLGLDNELRLVGHGISTCATCDGFFFRNEEIAVVGGGDSALEEANFLSRFASKVTVIHRRDELRASKIMQERARANEKIDFKWNTRVTAIHGEDKLSGLTLEDTITGTHSEMALSGLFIAIGHKPNTDLFKDKLELKDNGYITTAPNSTTSSVEGVFACGDVQDDTFRQAITAAGTGCMAALEAERWLEAQNNKSVKPQ